MTDQKKAVLRLPLIGRFEEIDVLDAVGKIVELTDKDEEKHDVLLKLERALGYYLMDSGGYQKILDLLFPEPETIKVNEVFNWSKRDFPLFLWVFAKSTGESDPPTNKDEEIKRLSSAWSALMLDLGEFKLDERFKEIKNEIKDLMPYLRKDRENPEQHSVLYALFEDNTEIMNEIWKRIVGEDICLIFVDDEPGFDEEWGLKGIGVEEVEVDISEGAVISCKKIKRDKCDLWWINPVGDIEGKINGYDNELTNNKILNILNSPILERHQDKKSILPVLVIDLLYKDENGINKIEGDNLIRELRSKECGIKTPLIIGFTGGKSPFVINSAVKAGADIVIQKERGETIKLSDLQHGSGNPGGLFDLLWALSKNISRWRFMEECKKYLHDELKGINFYRPILEPLFFSIENESPFWKEYLSNWLREIEDIRLKAIFENEHD